MKLLNVFKNHDNNKILKTVYRGNGYLIYNKVRIRLAATAGTKLFIRILKGECSETNINL